MYKVVPQGDFYLVVDTDTHRIIGRHADKLKAERQRRFLRSKKRKKQ